MKHRKGAALHIALVWHHLSQQTDYISAKMSSQLSYLASRNRAVYYTRVTGHVRAREYLHYRQNDRR